MRTLERRLNALDGGDANLMRDVTQMTDAQLHAVIVSDLRREDPELAARYVAASANERAALLAAWCGCRPA